MARLKSFVKPSQILEESRVLANGFKIVEKTELEGSFHLILLPELRHSVTHWRENVGCTVSLRL